MKLSLGYVPEWPKGFSSQAISKLKDKNRDEDISIKSLTNTSNKEQSNQMDNNLK